MRGKPAQFEFKKGNTWRQVTTNVPPQMYMELRSQVTNEITMSQVLRELIADSQLMKAGNLPRPSWSVELTEHMVALRAEMNAQKQAREDVELALFELKKEIAELRSDVSEKTMIIQEEQESEPILTLLETAPADESTRVQVEKEREKEPEKPTSIIGRLTEMLGVVRKTA